MDGNVVVVVVVWYRLLMMGGVFVCIVFVCVFVLYVCADGVKRTAHQQQQRFLCAYRLVCVHSTYGFPLQSHTHMQPTYTVPKDIRIYKRADLISHTDRPSVHPSWPT